MFIWSAQVHVDINVEVLDILSVNDREFSITMTMYFTVIWKEIRIKTNRSVEEVGMLNQNIQYHDVRTFSIQSASTS